MWKSEMAAAEAVEEGEGGDEDDCFEEGDDPENDVVEEGDAEVAEALPPEPRRAEESPQPRLLAHQPPNQPLLRALFRRRC